MHFRRIRSATITTNRIPSGRKSTMQQIGEWYHHQLFPQVYLIIRGGKNSPALSRVSCCSALFWGGFIFYARRLPFRIAEMEQDEALYNNPEKDRIYERPGGDDVLRHAGWPFVRRFTLAPHTCWARRLPLSSPSPWRRRSAWQSRRISSCWPLSYAAGLSYPSTSLFRCITSTTPRSDEQARLYRSFYTGHAGRHVYRPAGIGPVSVATVLLFGNHGLVVNLMFSFLPVAVAYYFTIQSLGAKSGSSA